MRRSSWASGMGAGLLVAAVVFAGALWLIRAAAKERAEEREEARERVSGRGKLIKPRRDDLSAKELAAFVMLDHC